MLQRFRAFLELEFRYVAANKEADTYKAELLDNLMSRADDMIKNGEKDENVIYNTCIEKLGDFRSQLQAFQKTVNPKFQLKRALNIFLYALVFSLIVVGVYLAISLTGTMAWNKSWIILTSGFLGGIVAISVLACVKLCSKKKFGLARPFMHVAIVLSVVITYLCFSVLSKSGWEKSWLIFLIMAIFSTGIECIYDYLTESKLANLSLMVFLPVSFSIVYVMLCLAGMLTWHPYWFLPAIAVVFDFIFAIFLLKKKLK